MLSLPKFESMVMGDGFEYFKLTRRAPIYHVLQMVKGNVLITEYEGRLVQISPREAAKLGLIGVRKR